MDSLTHALAGSLVADAMPFTRKLGSKAQLAAVLAGMAPDLDMVPAFIANFPPKKFDFPSLFNRELVAAYHRGYTHSLVFTFLAALLLGWLCLRWNKGQGRWWQWFVIVWGAFLSHILLDYTNPWGVRAWLPFDAERVSIDLMPFLSPLFTGLLAAAFVLNHVFRDPYRRPDDPPFPQPWRRRSSAVLDALAGVTPTAWVFIALLTARVWLAAYGVFPLPGLD